MKPRHARMLAILVVLIAVFAGAVRAGNTYMNDFPNVTVVEPDCHTFVINVSQGSGSSAVLTLRVHDVDEEDGELDEVRLNGHFLGHLTGNDGVWSTTSFDITSEIVYAGDNTIEICIDPGGGEATDWQAEIDWGQILVDGGSADDADIVSVSASGTWDDIDVSTVVHATNEDDYRLEINLLDSVGNNKDICVQTFHLTAGATSTIGCVVNLPSEPTATETFTVEANLFNDSTEIQQQVKTTTWTYVSNHPPTASNRSVSTDEDAPYVFAVGDFGYSDSDGDPMDHVKIASLESVGNLRLAGAHVLLGQEIAASQISAGNLTYESLTDENGSPYDSFRFEVHDGTEPSASDYQMTINVAPVNDPPTASSGVVSTDEDTPLVFAVGDFGYSDEESDPMDHVKITSLESIGDLRLAGAHVLLGQEIAASQISAGNLTYESLTDENGSPYDSFRFEVHDGTDPSASDYQMTINVAPVNDPPASSDDVHEAEENEPGDIDVLGNDSDVDGDILSVFSVTDPVHGMAEIVGSLVRYTPDAFYAGPDSFSYVARDPSGAEDTAFVSITVVHPNLAPTANAGGIYESDTKTPVTFDGKFSTDPDVSDILEYRWDVDGDGVWDTGWLAGRGFEHLYDRPFLGRAILEVRDIYRGLPLGTSDQDDAFVKISPAPTQLAISVYVDLNGNGEFDDGDVGLPGVQLLLDEGVELVTGDDGTALTDDVVPGIHTIRISENGVSYLRDRGFFLSEEALASVELESGDWVALFFSPEARGFLEVDLGAEEDGGSE